MKNLLSFEYKRFLRNNMLFLTLFLILLIGLLGFILNILFNSNANSPQISMLSLYNAYTQFMFLICGFVFVYTFANDFSKGIYIFLDQLGHSLKQVVFSKILMLALFVIPTVDIVFLTMNIVYNNTNWGYFLFLVLSIDLGIIFIILLSAMVSLLFRRTITSVLIFYGLFIVFNIANLLLYGITNPADGNSLSTYIACKLIGAKPGNIYIDKLNIPTYPLGICLAFLIPIIWICSFVISILLMTRKRVKS